MAQQLPDDPIDEAETPDEQLRPSVGLETAIAAGADVTTAADVQDSDRDPEELDHGANPV